MEIRFSDLAIAGANRLFENEMVRASALSSIAVHVRFDPIENSIRLERPARGNLWVTKLFAGFDIRVMFERGEDITIWSIARASPHETATE